MVSCCGTGLQPYQTVVLWQPVLGTMMVDMMEAMLKVGHSIMNCSSSCCSLSWLPCSAIFFSTGMRLGSWRGSGWSRSQLVWIRNQLVSLSSQQACTASTSRSITMPSLAPTPEITQQTGPPILSVLSLWTAAAQVVCSQRVLRSSQTVGMALSLRMLIRSWLKSLALRVSTLMAKAPWRMPVRAKALPTTVSTLYSRCPPLQYSTLVSSLASSSHISKSRLRPCSTLPSSLRTRIPVQALKVENSQKKFRKKILSKGRPLSSAMASASATKSGYLNSFLAYHSTPSKNPLGMGSRSTKSMKRERGSLKSRMMGAQRVLGSSSRLTLQVRGLCDSTGPTWGTTVASATARRQRQAINLLINRNYYHYCGHYHLAHPIPLLFPLPSNHPALWQLAVWDGGGGCF